MDGSALLLTLRTMAATVRTCRESGHGTGLDGWTCAAFANCGSKAVPLLRPPNLVFHHFFLYRSARLHNARTHNNASILSRPIPTHHQSIPPTPLLNRNSSHELACKRILVLHDERTRQTCSLCISLKGSVSFFVCSTSRYSRGHLTYSNNNQRGI